MEIVVIGRHTEVPERFRRHVEEKLAKIGQYAPRAHRVDVEITHERNPRFAGMSERVELTVRDKGPVVRAEASADDRYAALDAAATKLVERLRRAHERRKEHHLKPAVGSLDVRAQVQRAPEAPSTVAAPAVATTVGATTVGDVTESTLGDSPVVIREKVHHGAPITVEDALYEMELVGHDFYLFVDAETALPSVAYRRRGWSYGVIHLDVPVATAGGV
jgi:ribosomal subunit interface protein